MPQLALERDSSASLVRGYIYGDGRISMGTPSTTAYYSADVLGSPTALSGSTGALLGQYDTMPVVAVTAGLTGCAAGIVADMLLHKSVHGAFP